MMNPNILNKNPLMFFDRAVNAQRSQLLTVMADAVSECRTAADQAAELNETGQVGLLRLAEVWSAIRAKEGMGGLVLEGTEAKILSDVVAQFYAYLSGCMFNDPVGMAIYLKPSEQKEFLEAMDYAQASPSLSQAQRLKKLSQEGGCTLDAMCEVMNEIKKDELDHVTIKNDVLRKYFPKSYTPKQMQDTIIRLLEKWQRSKQRDMER